MADSKISELSLAGALTGSEHVPIVQSGATVKTTIESIASIAGSIQPSNNNYRLTLTTATPVTTSDVTTSSTLYWTPYIGDRASLYTGSGWVEYDGGEISLALSSLTSAKNYDVLIDYNSGSPQIVLEAWSSDTVRATALTKQDHVYVLTGNLDHRYVGTIRTISTSATCDMGGGNSDNVGAKRFVWNYYNRVRRTMDVREDAANWNYSNTSTWRCANGNNDNIIQWVQGVVEDHVDATLGVACTAGSSGSGSSQSAIGLDSTSSMGSNSMAACFYGGNLQFMTSYRHDLTSAPGYHFYSWLERATQSGTTTWYGNAGNDSFQSRLCGTIWG